MIVFRMIDNLLIDEHSLSEIKLPEDHFVLNQSDNSYTVWDIYEPGKLEPG